MTKTLEINVNEAKTIMEGLLIIGDEANRMVEHFDWLITDEEYEGKNTDLLKASRKQQAEIRNTADTTYNKIKAMFVGAL